MTPTQALQKNTKKEGKTKTKKKSLKKSKSTIHFSVQEKVMTITTLQH